VTKRVSENEVELSLPGSYHHDVERLTVEVLVRAWEAATPRLLSNSSIEEVRRFCVAQ